jgi:hypothetical protein
MNFGQFHSNVILPAEYAFFSSMVKLENMLQSLNEPENSAYRSPTSYVLPDGSNYIPSQWIKQNSNHSLIKNDTDNISNINNSNSSNNRSSSSNNNNNNNSDNDNNNNDDKNTENSNFAVSSGSNSCNNSPKKTPEKVLKVVLTELYAKCYGEPFPSSNFVCNQITQTPSLWECTLKIPSKADKANILTFDGKGATKLEAQNDAAKKALEEWR